MDIPPQLAAILNHQHGLLTRRQALEAGMTRAQLRWVVGRRWRLVLPAVMATFTGRLDNRQRLVAARLWAGPTAQVSGATAVRWHGLGDLPDDGMVRLLVGWGQSSTRCGFVVRGRTTRLDARPVVSGVVAVCSRPRALVDAAREIRDVDAVRRLLLEAVQRRQVTGEQLLAEVEGGAAQGSRMVREALRTVATGAWSLPEADVLAELARSTVLPRVWANPSLETPDGRRLPTPDFWVDEVALAGQVNSRAFHARDADWDATVSSDGVFAEHGITVVAITSAGFARDPAAVRRRVERAYLAASRRGERPPVVMRPRAWGR